MSTQRRGWYLMLDENENVLGVHEFGTLQGYGDTWSMTAFFEDNGTEPVRDLVWQERRWKLLVDEDGRGLRVLSDEAAEAAERASQGTVVPINGSLWDQIFASPGHDSELDYILMSEDWLERAVRGTDEEKETYGVMAHRGATRALRTLELADLRRAPGVDVPERRQRAEAAIDGVVAILPNLPAAYIRQKKNSDDLLRSMIPAK